MAKPIDIRAADGYVLRGLAWRHPRIASRCHPVAIINPATSVRGQYYTRFADYLHAQGWDVVTFDYRGIGASRHGSLRQLNAGWVDWGQHDLEGVLQYVMECSPGQPVDVIGHSAGGFIIGLAESAHRIRRIFTVGAQYAYWPDYAPSSRWTMFLRWHVAMPLIARLLGYVPAKRLGWMEDTPKGVALDWAGMGPRFERTIRCDDRAREGAFEADTLVRRFGKVQASILALGIDDDPFGTRPALDRLLAYFTGSERHHLRLTPAQIGQDRIGHFAFFHERFRDTLWPLASDWLRTGEPPLSTDEALKRWPANESVSGRDTR